MESLLPAPCYIDLKTYVYSLVQYGHGCNLVSSYIATFQLFFCPQLNNSVFISTADLQSFTTTCYHLKRLFARSYTYNIYIYIYIYEQ